MSRATHARRRRGDAPAILRRAADGTSVAALVLVAAATVLGAPRAAVAAAAGAADESTAGGVPDVGDERGCVPGAGDCFAAHGGPGCEWGPCCELVCDVMPECCTNGWDALCAEMAFDLCERPPACRVAVHDCLDVDKDAGCRDRGCCELVCAIDPFCCSSRWDRLCASAALETCGVGDCVVSAPDALDEAEACGEPVNDGCEQPDGFAAGAVALGQTLNGRTYANGRRDVDWYAIDADGGAAEVRVRAAFPAEVSVVVGDCAQGFTAVDAIAVPACGEGTLAVPAGLGPAWVVIAPGREGAPILRGIPCTDVPDPPTRTFGDRYVLALRPVEPG